MPRITVTISDELDEVLEDKSGDEGEFGSKSEMMRYLAEHGRDAEELQQRVDELEDELEAVREQRDQLQERVGDLDDLERKVERLQNEKRMLLAEREEKAELARYVEDERETQQRWREAPMWTRMKWRVVGMPSTESA